MNQPTVSSNPLPLSSFSSPIRHVLKPINEDLENEEEGSLLIALSSSVDSKREELQQIYHDIIKSKADDIRENLRNETNENQIKTVHFHGNEIKNVSSIRLPINSTTTNQVNKPPNEIPTFNSTYKVDKSKTSSSRAASKPKIPVKSSPTKKILSKIYFFLREKIYI